MEGVSGCDLLDFSHMRVLRRRRRSVLLLWCCWCRSTELEHADNRYYVVQLEGTDRLIVDFHKHLLVLGLLIVSRPC